MLTPGRRGFPGLKWRGLAQKGVLSRRQRNPPPTTHLPQPALYTAVLQGTHRVKQPEESLLKPPQSKEGFHQTPRKELI